MPLANGLANGVSDVHSGRATGKKQVSDYTKALELLEQDYDAKDGLDVHTLLDSSAHGALTYNDFLILPGFIGKSGRGTRCRAC